MIILAVLLCVIGIIACLWPRPKPKVPCCYLGCDRAATWHVALTDSIVRDDYVEMCDRHVLTTEGCITRITNE